MSDFNLDAFLASQQAEGSSQGEGDFTISHAKAAQKMTQYSLPREHTWVLKLIQAAVGWGSHSIELKQTRTHSTFHFQMNRPDRLPTNEEFVQALLRANFESPKGVDRLGAALRVLVERAHLSFMLSMDRGDQQSQAIYAGVYFTDLGEDRRVKLRSKWGRGLTLMIHHISHTDTNRLLLSYIPIREFGLPMLLELEEFAHVSPVPITVDGRRIDGVLHSRAFAWSYHKKLLRILGLEVRDPSFPSVDLGREFCDLVVSLRTTPQRMSQKVSEAEWRSHDVYFVLGVRAEKDFFDTLSAETLSCIHWVTDGVVVQTENLPIATKFLSLDIYVGTEGLKTDLTGFQLVESATLKERRQLLRESVSEALMLELLENRDLFDPDLDPRMKGITVDSKESLVSVAVGRVGGFLRKHMVTTKPKSVQWTMTPIAKRYPQELKSLSEGLT